MWVARSKVVTGKRSSYLNGRLILLSEKTSVADWERVMAENSKSSWKDEFFVIVLSIPLILAFIPGLYIDDKDKDLSRVPAPRDFSSLSSETTISSNFIILNTILALSYKKIYC